VRQFGTNNIVADLIIETIARCHQWRLSRIAKGSVLRTRCSEHAHLRIAKGDGVGFRTAMNRIWLLRALELTL
jgi:hypothetical protein